jgi:hypothetical protein
MSHQFRVYLLPSDIQVVFSELSKQLPVRFLHESSSTADPVELQSPIQNYSIKLGKSQATSVSCFLTPNDRTDLDIGSYPKLREWVIRPSSEAIEFSGCDFDGEALFVGRFYFQSDMLVDGAIFQKRAEFTKWANAVFRFVKSSLVRDAALAAYVGADAENFRRQGGRFASFVNSTGEPIYE